MRNKKQYIQNIYCEKNEMNTPIKITEEKNLKVLNLNKMNYLYYFLIEFF